MRLARFTLSIRVLVNRQLNVSAGLPAEAAREARAQRRLVARGGFEPPKPLGRQIYSLLRLTASLPRRISRPTLPRSSSHRIGELYRCRDLPGTKEVPSADLRVGDARILELAKGFEPPTS